MKLSEVDVSKISPMMRQYVEVKKQYPKHIVFFRIGDFYEMFFEDAVVVSHELQLTLTGKDCGLEERAPMCGVPHHACDTYMKKLIDKGYNVVICEQMEDPALTKTLVKRDVVRVVTPGTLIESNMLDDDSNNYLCALYIDGKSYSICFADISTGEVNLIENSDDNTEIETQIINELSRFNPVEILINDRCLDMIEVEQFIKQKIKASVQLLDSNQFDAQRQSDYVFKQFCVDSFDDLGLSESEIGVNCLCAMFRYISDTQKALVGRFSEIKLSRKEVNMKLGFTARRNLELCETMRNKEKKGSLLWVLDHTRTSMGKRLLKNCIEQPLVMPVAIMDRLDAVSELIDNSVNLSELGECLSGVYDLERLMTRVMFKTANPRDMKSLSVTALKLPEIKSLLSGFKSKLLKNTDEKISTLDEISSLIENAIVDEPPVNMKDGGIIKDGFNSQLDELREIIHGEKSIIDKIEEAEKEKTGIKNIKIGYNRVFGYYIEVTKSNYDMVPDYYIRKQTLTNCERFITQELKDAENTILGANDKVVNLETEIFAEVRNFVATKLKEVSETASAIALIDVLCSFAVTAVNNNYTKPEIAIDGVISIKDGRHPVVELMQTNEMFVPNDTYLDLTDNKMFIITGPNMSGKSTYMRQVALITLMAQIGSFVPAKSAKISIVDQIFTRVGASDDLTAGQSTFMVEMSEVADIVKHATKNSLVILDEVGRGTSTFDGISIARAVCEHIANTKSLGCKTLFATHYHELIELENELSGCRNYSVAVKRNSEGIKFLRKIVPGGVDESYGIEVAKLAGLPNKIIKRANAFLEQMEEQNNTSTVKTNNDSQMSFEKINDSIITEKLKKTNIDELSDEDIRYFLKDLLKFVK